jgi:hypothetical protein
MRLNIHVIPIYLFKQSADQISPESEEKNEYGNHNTAYSQPSKKLNFSMRLAQRVEPLNIERIDLMLLAIEQRHFSMKILRAFE